METRASIKEAIQANNTAAIADFKPEDLLDFSDSQYVNIVLYAIREGHLEGMQAILASIERAFGKKKRDELLKSEDIYHRGALALAVIADNVRTLEFLHQTLAFDINRRDISSPLGHAIKRNAPKAFDYLIQRQAKVTQEELQLIPGSEFSTYFNSPHNFLRIIEAGNILLFDLIMRHIKTQSQEEMQKFLTHKDANQRHALCLAAALNRHAMSVNLVFMDFEHTDTDVFGKRPLYYFAQHDRFSLFFHCSAKLQAFNAEEAALLSQRRHNISLGTKTDRNTAANGLTNDVHKVSQLGRVPKAFPVEHPRNYRSFSEERERQLLRQAATQLYFAFNHHLKISNVNLAAVEIQIMHLEFNGKHNLFIAANKPEVLVYLPEFIADKKNLTEIFTKAHFPSDKEGKLRSARYAAKLKARVMRGHPITLFADKTDQQHTEEVIALLKEGEPRNLPLEINNKSQFSDNSKQLLRRTFLKNENHIYIITLPKYAAHPGRHAEEFLADIASFAKEVGRTEGVDPYSCAGGKKRPCMGCTGRMTGLITQFGSHPGRLWVQTLENQTGPAAENTVNAVLTSPAHVSICKDGTSASDYDSGSDSEVEEKPHRGPR